MIPPLLRERLDMRWVELEELDRDRSFPERADAP